MNAKPFAQTPCLLLRATLIAAVLTATHVASATSRDRTATATHARLERARQDLQELRGQVRHALAGRVARSDSRLARDLDAQLSDVRRLVTSHFAPRSDAGRILRSQLERLAALFEAMRQERRATAAMAGTPFSKATTLLRIAASCADALESFLALVADFAHSAPKGRTSHIRVLDARERAKPDPIAPSLRAQDLDFSAERPRA